MHCSMDNTVNECKAWRTAGWPRHVILEFLLESCWFCRFRFLESSVESCKLCHFLFVLYVYVHMESSHAGQENCEKTVIIR